MKVTTPQLTTRGLTISKSSIIPTVLKCIHSYFLLISVQMKLKLDNGCNSSGYSDSSLEEDSSDIDTKSEEDTTDVDSSDTNSTDDDDSSGND